MDIIRYNNDTQVLTDHDINNCMLNACAGLGLNDLEDLENISTSKFNIVLRAVGSMIRDSQLLVINDNNKININKDYIYILCDTYINICNIYDKRISINGFMYFIGLSSNYLQSTKDNNILIELNNGFNTLYAVISKKLDDADNQLQQDKARDSKQAVLNLAYNNYKHGWNGTIKSNELKATVKSLDEIRENRTQNGNNNAVSVKMSNFE